MPCVIPSDSQPRGCEQSAPKLFSFHLWLGGILVGCWNCDQLLLVQIPAALLSSATLDKLLTHMPLSPSSVIWHQAIGGDALWLGRLP